MPSIYEALLQATPSEGDFLSKDPFALAGVSIAKQPMGKARSNSEAIFAPLVQGLIAGALMGFGKQNARESMWDAYRASPGVLASPEQASLRAALEQSGGSVGPVASGDAYSALLRVPDLTLEEAPENFNANRAQSQMLVAALQQQAKIEADAKIAEEAAKIAAQTSPEAIAAKEKLAEAEARGKMRGEGGAAIPGLEGVPKRYETEAIKELGLKQEMAAAEQEIADIYDSWDGTDMVGALVPGVHTGAKQKLASVRNRLLFLANKAAGHEINETPLRNLLEAQEIRWNDGAEELEAKKEALLKVIRTARQQTPILDGLAASAPAEALATTPPATAETRRINGVDYVKVPGGWKAAR